MLDIEIRGKIYQACSEWKDLTLAEFIELSKVKIPEKLEKLWIASAQLNTDGKKEKKAAQVNYDAATKAITQADLIKHFPEYYGKVIRLLTEIPEAIIDILHGDARTDMFDSILRGFALSLVYSAPVIIKKGAVEIYEPEEITSFEMKGVTYLFPKSLKLYDEFIPMADEKVISFTEASDIDLAIRDLRSEGVKQFPVFMGIYCRRKGEEYSEATAIARAETFKEADMSVVWALFFYIVQLTHISQNFIQTYLLHQVEQAGKAITEVAD